MSSILSQLGSLTSFLSGDSGKGLAARLREQDRHLREQWRHQYNGHEMEAVYEGIETLSEIEIPAAATKAEALRQKWLREDEELLSKLQAPENDKDPTL